jgi:hypothetical protein
MSLLAVVVSHKTAPVDLLEQLAMGADDAVKALHELTGSAHVSEAIVLATCNRVEVFAEVDRFHGGVTDVSRVLARQAGTSVEQLSPHVTVHHEDQAVTHLFTVAAGLDSGGQAGTHRDRHRPGRRVAGVGLPGPRRGPHRLPAGPPGAHPRGACVRSGTRSSAAVSHRRR